MASRPVPSDWPQVKREAAERRAQAVYLEIKAEREEDVIPLETAVP